MHNYMLADIARVLKKRSVRVGIPGFELCLALLLLFYGGNGAVSADMRRATEFALDFFPLVIGTLLFVSVYADDFKCRAMQVAIGAGVSREGIVLAKFGECALLLLFTLVPTAALCFLLPGARRLFYTDAEAVSVALTVAQVFLRTLGFMQLAATLCFLTQNSLQGAIAFALLSSNAMFILITMTLLTGPLKDNVGRLRPFLYTALLRSVQNNIQDGKPFVGIFVLALGIYMILPLLLVLLGFRKKELSF
nr:hypothetical protein [uncultured Stomatobaculum sp.]